MKIGLVCPYNIAGGGGVQEVVLSLQAELLRRGHDAYIITPQPRDYDQEYAENKHLIFLGTATDFNSPTHTSLQISASMNDDIDSMLRDHKFDVLHFHEPWIPVLSRQILTRSNTLNIATFHAALPDTRITRTVIRAVTPYTRSVLKYIDEFTAVSDAAAEYVSSLSGETVAIIPNGIDLSRYKAPAQPSDQKKHKTIFYIGRLENRKGIDYLLQAFHLLRQKHDDVSLVIAGDGPDRAKLEQLAEDLELVDVSFVGYISEEQKIKYLQTSDLFCSAALYGESFGIVLLEAMASGLVTVAGNNPGYASVLQGIGALSLANPKESKEFAHRMELLLYEKDLRKLWRSWAKDQVRQYNYKYITDQYEEFYVQALAKRGKHHRLKLLPHKKKKLITKTTS